MQDFAPHPMPKRQPGKHYRKQDELALWVKSSALQLTDPNRHAP